MFPSFDLVSIRYSIDRLAELNKLKHEKKKFFQPVRCEARCYHWKKEMDSWLTASKKGPTARPPILEGLTATLGKEVNDDL